MLKHYKLQKHKKCLQNLLLEALENTLIQYLQWKFIHKIVIFVFQEVMMDF